jgi:hypothetical protein
MKIARPSVVEERWLLLAARYPALRAAVDSSGGAGRWKSTTWLGRCLGFLLGLMGTSLLGGVLTPFPSTLLVAGLLLVAAAEYLVAQRRVYRSGVEEALYLCGAVAIVVQLLIWSTGRNEALGTASVAAAVLFVGWRLLNPLFTTIAAALLSLAVALSGGSLFGDGMNTLEAAIFCSALAVGALIAGQREWQRPSHDHMLDGLVIAMPWIACVWLTTEDRNGSIVAYAALALALGFFVLCLVTGIRRREHAPLIGALGNLVCVGHVLHRLLPWPLHWLLIALGVVALAVAVVLERALRGRSEGITSRPMDEPSGIDLLQLAGAAHLTPAPVAAPQAGVQGQGGEFGGGGASGRF